MHPFLIGSLVLFFSLVLVAQYFVWITFWVFGLFKCKKEAIIYSVPILGILLVIIFTGKLFFKRDYNNSVDDVSPYE